MGHRRRFFEGNHGYWIGALVPMVIVIERYGAGWVEEDLLISRTGKTEIN
jgi:hypothetical protein